MATRTGAKTGAITTKGYRDRLAFLHVARADLGGDRKATSAELFSFRSEFPQPLAPRHLVTEVEERLNFKGEVLVPLSDDDAGRNVSAEFHALGAIRVIARCMVMGRAAGTAAAMCVKENVIPRNLDGVRVRRALVEQGVPLDQAPGGR